MNLEKTLLSCVFLKVLTCADRLLCKDLFIEFLAAENSNPEGNPLSSCPAPRDSGAEPAHTGIWGFGFTLNLGLLARAGLGVLLRGEHKTFKGDFCSISTPFLGLAERGLWHWADPGKDSARFFQPLALCGGRGRRH